jgi:hypothetical protein
MQQVRAARGGRQRARAQRIWSRKPETDSWEQVQGAAPRQSVRRCGAGCALPRSCLQHSKSAACLWSGPRGSCQNAGQNARPPLAERPHPHRVAIAALNAPATDGLCIPPRARRHPRSPTRRPAAALNTLHTHTQDAAKIDDMADFYGQGEARRGDFPGNRGAPGAPGARRIEPALTRPRIWPAQVACACAIMGIVAMKL